jgi:hypothetical protein
MKIKWKLLFTWLSGLLLAGGAWQLEIVLLRALHNEPYSLPFFVTTQTPSVFWSFVWLFSIFVSYLILVIVRYKKNLKIMFLSLALFLFGISQLAIVHTKTINRESYSPPFIKLKTSTPMELGEKSFSPILQPSLWGDVWMVLIISSYILLLV